MTISKKTIGFDRKIQLDWMDAVADLAAKGVPTNQIRYALDDILSSQIIGNAKGGARTKTLTVLSKIWLDTSTEARSLRNIALELFPKLNSNMRIVLHLGMTMTTYPFFFDILIQIGRLLTLQDKVSKSQVSRRIIEQWGDTERISRSTRHVLQTLKLWNILSPSTKNGTYTANHIIKVQNVRLKMWLIECLLFSLNKHTITLQEIVNHPSLFTIKYDLSAHEIENTSGLDIMCQHMDTNLILTLPVISKQVQENI